jgi:hypothetical protein
LRAEALRQNAMTMRLSAGVRAILTVSFLGLLIPPALSQDRPARPVPATPGSAGITWQRTVQMTDGRTFVSDGGLAIDAALAKPATLPPTVIPGAAFERLFATQSPNEFGLSQLSANPDGRTYQSPSGVHMRKTYIDFLRSTLPAAKVRLRMGAAREPVIIHLDGKPVGIFMPVVPPAAQ